MLTLKLINEETERVIKGLKKKHFENAEDAIAEVIETDRRRREAQQKLDSNLSETKKLSARIGMLMKDGKKDEAEEIKKNVTALKEISKQLEAEKAQCEKDLTLQLCSIPNIPMMMCRKDVTQVTMLWLRKEAVCLNCRRMRYATGIYARNSIS